MTKSRNPFQRIRLVYRRSSTLLKCVVLASILLSAVALFAIRAAIVNAQEEKEAQRAKAAALEQENSEYETINAQEGTIEWILQIAKRELGLVEPGTEFFNPTE